MEYDKRSVDLAIQEVQGRKTYLVHTIETVAASYEVFAQPGETYEDVKRRFESASYKPEDYSMYDYEVLSFFVDEVNVTNKEAA